MFAGKNGSKSQIFLPHLVTTLTVEVSISKSSQFILVQKCT